MEKILVLSDIHGGFARARAAVMMHRECKTVIFLGDGARYISALEQVHPEAAFFAVRGNNDTLFDGDYPLESILDIGGKRIFICHGHTYFVKGGVGAIYNAAKNADCDIILHGHTHCVVDEYNSEYGIYRFNPGTVGDMRTGKYTYGLLSIDKQSVLFSVGEIE